MTQLKDFVGKKLLWAGEDPVSCYTCFLFEGGKGFTIDIDTLHHLKNAEETCRKIMEETRDATDTATSLRLCLEGENEVDNTLDLWLKAGLLQTKEEAAELLKTLENIKNGRNKAEAGKTDEAGEVIGAPGDSEQTNDGEVPS